MARSSLTMQLGIALLVVCLFDVVFTEDKTLSRQKRGFRLNSASRVAHGYGKRGFLPPSSSEHILQVPLSQLTNPADFAEDSDLGSIMTVNEFAQLLASHPNLARALLKKFVDVDGDDVISTEELFRPVMKK